MTQKMSVIYKAPEGDNKVCEAFGHTFFDGKAEEIEVSDEVAEKIKKNPNFHPGGGAKADPHPKEDDDHGKAHKK